MGLPWAEIKVLAGLCSFLKALRKNPFPYPLLFLEASLACGPQHPPRAASL